MSKRKWNHRKKYSDGWVEKSHRLSWRKQLLVISTCLLPLLALPLIVMNFEDDYDLADEDGADEDGADKDGAEEYGADEDGD